MAYSLKTLMTRNAEAIAKREANAIVATESTLPVEADSVIIPAQTDFNALMNAAKTEAANRKAEIKAEADRIAAQAREDERQLAAMDDDYAPNHYVPGTDLVLASSTAIDLIEDDGTSLIDHDSDSVEYDDIMAGVNIEPDPSQKAAVFKLCGVQYGCLIGAAGTGKTTTTRLLLHTLINGDAANGIQPLRLSKVNLRAYLSSTNEEGEEGEAAKEVIPSIAFCAYTGQATQVIKRNMPGNWQKNVFTIHGLLGFFPETYYDSFEEKEKMRFVPYYTKENKMPWDVIFVDEASMVALDLWHMLLDASKPGCRFYFIGDINQLPPPIGMGILGFALAKWPVAELSTVHRSSNDAENKIVNAAHKVLIGKPIEFDDPKTNPNWRVIGMELPHSTQEAYNHVIALCKGLSTKKTPEGDDVYDPWRDRVMTVMNGFDDNSTASLLGQFPINEALSQIFADPTKPRIVISCKTSTKRFAEGYRVMATKNESPAELNRVTNGLTGNIIGIEDNPKWIGDRRLVGVESEVALNRREMLNQAMGKGGESAMDAAQRASSALDSVSWDGTLSADEGTAERNGGPASHIVTVKFDNGGIRKYSMNAQIEQLMIAYASTTHKAQGAEMPTAIIVVHHSQKSMLCRENLYTAVTRARQRVIVLYSNYGLQIALAKQRITGNTIEQKLKGYAAMLGEGPAANSLGFKLVNVRLTEFD